MSPLNSRALVLGSVVGFSLLVLLLIRYIPKSKISPISPISQPEPTPTSYIDQIRNIPKGEYTKREIFKLYQYSNLTETQRIEIQKKFAQKLGINYIKDEEYKIFNTSLCTGFEVEGVALHLANIQKQFGNSTSGIEKYAFFSLTAPYFQCPKYLPDVLNIADKSSDKSNLKLPHISS